MRWGIILLGGLWTWTLSPAHAQVSSHIPPTDPVYQDLRYLEAEGLVDSLFLASRPLTRLEVAQAIARAESTFEAANPEQTHPLITRLQARYGFSRLSPPQDGSRGGWGGMRLNTLDIGYVGIREPSRPVPKTNAFTTPFLRDREGRHFDQGDNLSIEAGGDWQIRPWVVAAGRVRVQNDLENPGNGQAQLLSLYVKTKLGGPLVLFVGRDSMAWGYNLSGSLGLGPNAKPFDMVKLDTSRPLHGPWILRHLGPIKPLVFFTHMGNNRQDFKRPYLLGMRIDTAPHPSLRIGVYRWMQFGGEGAPAGSVWDFLGDFFVFRSDDPVQAPKRHINNGVGLHGQWRLPFRYDVTVFGEMFWEAVGAPGGPFSFLPKPFLSANTSRSIGFSIWSLLDHNRLGIHAEYLDTSKAAYRHYQYVSGFTYNQAIIGHDLGPEGMAGYFKITSRINPDVLGALDIELERRGGDEPQPEFRTRLLPGVAWDFSPKTRLTVQGGYERVWNFNFTPGADQQNSLFEMRLRVYY